MVPDFMELTVQCRKRDNQPNKQETIHSGKSYKGNKQDVRRIVWDRLWIG